jgi:hypothetical protein
VNLSEPKKKKKRRHYERRVTFPWERTGKTFTWLSRRRVGAAIALAITVLFAYTLVSLDDRRRRVHATRAAIRSVRVAVESFRADHGRCPRDIAELTRPSEVAGVSGRYLRENRSDGWGRPLEMRCPGWKHPSSADVSSQATHALFFPSETIE